MAPYLFWMLTMYGIAEIKIYTIGSAILINPVSIILFLYYSANKMLLRICK